MQMNVFKNLKKTKEAICFNVASSAVRSLYLNTVHIKFLNCSSLAVILELRYNAVERRNL